MWYPTCSSNELYHHGILGQKWGIRRFQNPDGSLTAAGRKRYGANSVEEISSAKGIKNRLNDLDKAMARNTRQIKDSTKRAEVGDLNSAIKVSEATSYIEKGRKETEALLKKASLSGYDINAKETVRFTDKGVQTVIAYAALANGGVIGGAIGGAALMYKSEKGTKYKVKESKADKVSKKITNDTINGASKKDIKKSFSTPRKAEHLSSGSSKALYKSKEERASKVNSAVKNDKYPISFLEAVQNKKMLSSGNKSELKKAYGEYLDDPEKFWKEGRKKYEEE